MSPLRAPADLAASRLQDEAGEKRSWVLLTQISRFCLLKKWGENLFRQGLTQIIWVIGLLMSDL